MSNKKYSVMCRTKKLSKGLCMVAALSVPALVLADDCAALRNAAQIGQNNEIRNLQNVQQQLLSGLNFQSQCVQQFNDAVSRTTAVITPNPGGMSQAVVSAIAEARNRIVNEACSKANASIADIRNQVNSELNKAVENANKGLTDAVGKDGAAIIKDTAQSTSNGGFSFDSILNSISNVMRR